METGGRREAMQAMGGAYISTTRPAGEQRRWVGVGVNNGAGRRRQRIEGTGGIWRSGNFED